MAFKDNLRKYRERAGLSSKELSKKLGISYTTYLNYENQSSEPRYDKLCEISHILHTSPNELLNYKSEPIDEITKIIHELSNMGFMVKSSLVRYSDSRTEQEYEIYIVDTECKNFTYIMNVNGDDLKKIYSDYKKRVGRDYKNNKALQITIRSIKVAAFNSALLNYINIRPDITEDDVEQLKNIKDTNTKK